MDVIRDFRRYLTKPHVRPWALSAPILVLLFCIPLLRPLRNPDPSQISDDELGRLATVQSMVEHRTLAIDGSSMTPTRGTVRIGDKLYADQPPTLAVLLAGPYWAMSSSNRECITIAAAPASSSRITMSMSSSSGEAPMTNGFSRSKSPRLRRPLRPIWANP